MANMSYCRFQNTLGDLRDCANALTTLSNEGGSLSADEAQAAMQLLALCVRMVDDHGETTLEQLQGEDPPDEDEEEEEDDEDPEQDPAR